MAENSIDNIRLQAAIRITLEAEAKAHVTSVTARCPKCGGKSTAVVGGAGAGDRQAHITNATTRAVTALTKDHIFHIAESGFDTIPKVRTPLTTRR